MEQEKIIDEIYEAAVIPELWIRTLDRMAAIAGAEGTLLFATGAKDKQFICSPSIESLVHAWISEGWSERDDRGKRLIPMTEPRFLTDLDAFSLAELDHIPIYTDFFRKNGIGWCAGTAIHSPSSDSIVFSIERLFAKGPVEPEAITALDRLRPHLARAVVLAAKAGLERARSQVFALEAVGLPALVLTATGRVVAANSHLAGCAPAMMIAAGDRLAFQNRATQALYADCLTRERQRDRDGAACSFPLPANEINAPAIVHLLPLRGAGRDIFTGAAFLLYATALSRHPPLPTILLQALYDLTPAEARVARLIGSGHTVAEAAHQLAVKSNTIRMQLKSVFAKTGIRRQADLVSLATIAQQPNKIESQHYPIG